MKNVTTIRHMYKCAESLEREAKSMERLIADDRKELETYKDIPADKLTPEDLTRMDIIEDRIRRYSENETAYRFLSEFIYDQNVVVSMRTDVCF